MSIRVMSVVWANAQVSGSELLVLLAMADFADDQGGNIYPSMQTLAHKARLSESQARRIVQRLNEVGIIEIEEPGGWDGRRNRANHYRIVLEALAGGGSNLTPPPLAPTRPPRADATTGGRADARGGGRVDATTVVAPTRPDPLLEPSFDPPLLETSTNEPMNEDRATAEDSFIPSSSPPTDPQIEVDDALDLLTDPDVGMDEATARELAAAHSFEFLERQIFAWLDHRDKIGNFGSIGALLARINNKFSAPPPTEEQQRSELYNRFHDRYDIYEPHRRRHRGYGDGRGRAVGTDTSPGHF